MKEKKRKKWPVFFWVGIAVIALVNVLFFMNKEPQPDIKKSDTQRENTETTHSEETDADDVEKPTSKTVYEEGDAVSFEPDIDKATGGVTNLDEIQSDDAMAMTKPVTSYLYREHIAALGTGEEYSPEEARLFQNDILEKIAVGDYETVVNEFYPETNIYRFSEGENLDTAGILSDIQNMWQAYQTGDTREFAEAVKENTVPISMMYSYVFTQMRDKRYAATDPESLTPLNDFQEVQLINSKVYRFTEETADEPTYKSRNIAKEIFELDADTNSVYVYDIVLKELLTGSDYVDTPFTVYIKEDIYGKLSVYGMYILEDMEHYTKSIVWWMSHDPLYKRAEERILEAQSENEYITLEEMQQLFESGY